jgi:hypothetical protein
MTGLVVDPAEGTPADARAVARWELNRLADRMDGVSATDAYTAAHLEESRARIDKALEAGLEAEGS